MSGAPELSDTDLLEYSGEHLFYDLQMFAIVSGVLAGGHAAEDWLRNVFLEAFALHLRNLTEFFYPASPTAGDLTSARFLAGDALPPMPPILAAGRERANMQLQHLTAERRISRITRASWPVREIELEMKRTAAVFVQLAVPGRLHPNVVSLVASWSDTGAPESN